MTPDQTLILVEGTSSNTTYPLQHTQAVLGADVHRFSGFVSLPDEKSTRSQYLQCKMLSGTSKEWMDKTAVSTMQEDYSYFKH